MISASSRPTGSTPGRPSRAHLISYPLSRDGAKVVALKDDLALYRLAFGQPRQEDLLDFLKRRGISGARRGAY